MTREGKNAGLEAINLGTGLGIAIGTAVCAIEKKKILSLAALRRFVARS